MHRAVSGRCPEPAGPEQSETTLRWIETINVRCGVGTDSDELARVLRDLENQVSGEPGFELAVYRERFLDGDWAIHLRWESDAPPTGRSSLGMKVADMVRPLALLDHSIWIECDWREKQS